MDHEKRGKFLRFRDFEKFLKFDSDFLATCFSFIHSHNTNTHHNTRKTDGFKNHSGNYDTVGPNTTHYASAQVLLLLEVSVVVILIILVVIDEGVIILIDEEVHGLILQKIIVIAEIGVGVSTKVFSGILPFLQLHVSLVDGVLQIRDPVAKTGNDALLLVKRTATRLAILY